MKIQNFLNNILYYQYKFKKTESKDQYVNKIIQFIKENFYEKNKLSNALTIEHEKIADKKITRL